MNRRPHNNKFEYYKRDLESKFYLGLTLRTGPGKSPWAC